MILLQILLGLIGALHAAAAYFYFSKERYAGTWATSWLAFTALGLWSVPQWPLTSSLIFGCAVAAWTYWWETIPALAERNWVAEDARQATAVIAGERLWVHDVRNFSWRGSHEFTSCWEDRGYDLAKLTAVDLFVCTWGDPRIAHLIVSFVFKDTNPLAFSIETRRETSEKWSILAGFMKSYELIMIAADERDVIRVRSNVRGESVRRYRLLLTPVMQRQLLVRYIDALNDIATRPRYYNTGYRNCTTEVVRILRAAGRAIPLDWRLLVSGYVPAYLYQHGLLARTQSFAALQATADIAALARLANESADFSARIRGTAGPAPDRGRAT